MTNGTAIEPFDFNGNPVRIFMRGGDPWFGNAEVCRVLEIANPSDAISRLDDDEKGVASAETPGGVQQIRIISESGLYRLILTSRSSGAAEFRRWVTREVLPAIRKTGAYVVSSAPVDRLDMLQGMLDQMRADRDRLNQHERAISALGARTEALEGNYGRITALAYAKLNGLRDGVDYLACLGRAASAVARRDGVPVEKAHSTIFGNVNAWPVEVWDEALERVGS